MKQTAKLNELQRAKRVLVSQGRAAVLATSTLSERLSEIAALCSETGVVQSGAAEAFARIWHEHTTKLDAQKATDELLEE